MSFFGPEVLGERKNVKQVLPRKPVQRKYAKRGDMHHHRCPECGFLWPCYVAECKLFDYHTCVDCKGHFVPAGAAAEEKQDAS